MDKQSLKKQGQNPGIGVNLIICNFAIGGETNKGKSPGASKHLWAPPRIAPTMKTPSSTVPTQFSMNIDLPGLCAIIKSIIVF